MRDQPRLYSDAERPVAAAGPALRPGRLQPLTCYLTPAEEATPGGRTNRMQRVAGLRRVLGDAVGFELVYDAPHNFLWKEGVGGGELAIHRKGATPARGFEATAGTPF